LSGDDGRFKQHLAVGLTTQVGLLSLKVGSNLALFCINQMNSVYSHNASAMMTAP